MKQLNETMGKALGILEIIPKKVRGNIDHPPNVVATTN